MKKNLKIILCLLVSALFLAACGGKATETPAAAIEITPLPPSTQGIEPTTLLSLTLTPMTASTPNNLYEDVEYKPASDRYPEMNIPIGGTSTCNIAGTNVTFTDLGGGVMQITSGSAAILVTAEAVKNADTIYKDGWVKLLLMGRISVAYTDGQWRTDWIKGCPAAARTPGPP